MSTCQEQSYPIYWCTKMFNCFKGKFTNREIQSFCSVFSGLVYCTFTTHIHKSLIMNWAGEGNRRRRRRVEPLNSPTAGAAGIAGVKCVSHSERKLILSSVICHRNLSSVTYNDRWQIAFPTLHKCWFNACFSCSLACCWLKWWKSTGWPTAGIFCE